MRSKRLRFVPALVLVLSAIPAAAPALPAPGDWEPAPSLSEPRRRPTVTQLADGRVLAVGGMRGQQALATAELYDPASGSWNAVASMSTPRADHAATLLADGRVLVAGGFNGGLSLASSEIFDPSTGAWTPGPSFRYARRGHALTTLDDGRVLVTGGLIGSDCSSGAIEHTELLDAQQTTWQLHTELLHGRVWHSADLLPGNRVLIVGGYGADIEGPRGSIGQPEIFDATTGVSEPGRYAIATVGHSSTRLPDGRLLFVGGCCFLVPGPHSAMARSEEIGAAHAAVYDPSTGEWVATAPMAVPRAWHTATPLPDGRVLVAGGAAIRGGTHVIGMRDDIPVAEAEIFDPVTGSWGEGGRLRRARLDHLAFAVGPNGVLVAGGIGEDAAITLSSAEQFTPPPAAPSATPAPRTPAQATPEPGSPPRIFSLPREHWKIATDLPVARTSAALALLPNGTVLVAGGAIEQHQATNRVDFFDPSRERWSTGPAMPQADASPTALVLADGRVLVTGAATPQLFDPAAGTWTTTAPPPVRRTVPTAVMLGDGRVLVTGGTGPSPTYCQTTRTAQIFDPRTGSWQVASPMAYARGGHSATLLADGRVLVAGGRHDATAEIYDPGKDRWAPTRFMNALHNRSTAHLLPDGRVLVIGGCCTWTPSVSFGSVSTPSQVANSPAEIYDPVANTWTLTPPMRVLRSGHVSAVLSDGSIVVAGGLVRGTAVNTEGRISNYDDTSSTEVYDISAQAWLPAGSLHGARYDHSAITLPGGRVLTVGGIERLEERLEYRFVPYVEVFRIR